MWIGQIQGADEVIKSAASHGWESAALVLIIILIITSFGYVLKRVLDGADIREKRITEEADSREKRLADRVTNLEGDIRGELFGQIRTNTEMMQKMNEAAQLISNAARQMIEWAIKLEVNLGARPCLLHVLHQGEFLEKVTDLWEDYKEKNHKENKTEV